MTTPSWYAVLTAVFLFCAAGCCCPDPASPRGVTASAPQADPSGQQVFIDLSTVRIPQSEIEDALGALRPNAENEPRALSEAETQALWKRWRENKALRIVQAPKVLALTGQEASLYVGETIGFAHAKAVKDQTGDREFAIEGRSVFVGYRMRVLPTVSDDGSRVALDLHSMQRALKAEYDQDQIAAMGQTAFLRDAVIEERIDAAFELQNGGHVLFSTPQVREDADGKYVTATVVTARVLRGTQPADVAISDE